MSAVTPIVDKGGCGRIVGFIPIADLTSPRVAALQMDMSSLYPLFRGLNVTKRKQQHDVINNL